MFSRKMTWRNYLVLKEVSPVIRFLTISDIIIFSSFGLIAPIFAIFINDNISQGNVAVVGMAGAIFLISKSILQIPFANLIDRIKGEKDDFLFLFIGALLISIVPLLYIFINSPLQLYAVQLLYGLSTAITLPTWLAIFTRHIDRKHAGIEWGIYQTFTNLGAGITASVGGFLAYYFGFNVLFVLVSLLSFLGSFSLLFIQKKMKKGKVFG